MKKDNMITISCFKRIEDDAVLKRCVYSPKFSMLIFFDLHDFLTL